VHPASIRIHVAPSTTSPGSRDPWRFGACPMMRAGHGDGAISIYFNYYF